MGEDSVIVHIEDNKVSNKEIFSSDVVSAVKAYAKKLIDKWDPKESDFIILKVPQTISLNLPLSKELFNRLERYGVKRVGDKAEASIPTYEIIYGNKWIGEDMQADKLTIVLPYINDEVTQQVVGNVLDSLMSTEEFGEELEE